MLPLPAGRDASAGASRYTRHRPERTLLYQLVREYYPAFTAQLAVQGTVLPSYVERALLSVSEHRFRSFGPKSVHFSWSGG